MKKYRVLVVDDMMFMRDMITNSIRKVFPNIETEVASNGTDAQNRMGQTHYDLILCDWELPDIKGNELLRWLRSHPSLSATPFIMVTGKSEKEAILEAKKLGVTDYIIKPLTIDLLSRKVRAALGGGAS